MMNRLSRYWSKVLTAAGISAAIAISFLGTPIAANAATAATDSVMIRNDASTDAGLIGSLNEGDEVVILDVVQSGDGYLWYYIELDNGNTGYVRSDLINASDEELAAFRSAAARPPGVRRPGSPPTSPGFGSGSPRTGRGSGS